MPRAKFIQDPESLYHVTGRCRNKDWFELPVSDVWQISSEQLFMLHHGYSVRILSFVLMSNHFHLLLKAPEGNLSAAMRHFMLEVTRDVHRLTGRINQVWGARFFRTRVGSFHHALNCYKYVYRNPVTAGLCERVEDYEFSSLHGLLGRSHLLFPVTLDAELFNDVEWTLSWLNKEPDNRNLEDMQKALRRSEFKLPRRNSYCHPLVDELL